MDDILLWVRLALHLITLSLLVSYRTTKTSRPVVSILASALAGVSLAAAAHIVIFRPELLQLPALLFTALGAVMVIRCRGNLARVFSKNAFHNSGQMR